MLEAKVNLISQSQIYCKRLHFFTIEDNKICIGNSELLTRFIQMTLYILDRAGLSVFAFVFIDEKILRA